MVWGKLLTFFFHYTMCVCVFVCVCPLKLGQRWPPTALIGIGIRVGLGMEVLRTPIHAAVEHDEVAP